MCVRTLLEVLQEHALHLAEDARFAGPLHMDDGRLEELVLRQVLLLASARRVVLVDPLVVDLLLRGRV